MGLLARWAQWLPVRRATWRVVDTTASGADIPSVIPPRGAVLVNALGSARFLAFECPCHGPHRIMLNLDASHYPRWVVRNPDPLSVWPSVDYRHDGQRCHFVLRGGIVKWVSDEEAEGTT